LHKAAVAVRANETAQRAIQVDLTAANRAKDEFLAMLSHELRNPLAAILMGAHLMRVRAKADDFVRDTAGTIERQAKQMSRLIDDLLDISRITFGKTPLKREPVDLGRLVARLADECRASGRLTHHRVSMESGSVWVEGDAARLEQVIHNLLGNAIKYTPAQGEISVRLRHEGEAAVLEVQDSGRGFSEPFGRRMFDVFVQGERTLHRPEGGMGIGLALVKRLVELHGGTVSAQSAGLGKGALFTVRLPAVAAPADEARPAPERRATPAKRKILVVEDNDDARRMLSLALAESGHEVHEAADGVAGVEAGTKLEPEIAFIDIGLPGMDGYEVARKLSDRMNRRKPVLIALTGYGQADDKQRAQEAGFAVHLTKPVDPQRLERIIAEAGRRRR
jgi:CheY-like chemotaxis protein/nitrogen-specific signal transduction histidine kinase